ncbi:hypothetical protein BDZ91DRAFT_852369 [Kalaharituber pfeilii]|nr:hypothetical protein BDZ91DRAFT_852369 [Kalaharituber pfeilii]
MPPRRPTATVTPSVSNTSQIGTPSSERPEEETLQAESASATPNPPSSTAQTRLTEEERLILVRLCLEYQDEHTPRNKTKFWLKIKLLLLEKIGKELKDPQQAITRMVEQLEIDDRRERKESGTVQQDTDLKQALRRWREHEAAIEQIQKQQKAENETAAEREVKEAKIHRQNLLLPLRDKRPITISSDSSDSAGNSDKEDKRAIKSLRDLRQTKKKQIEKELEESKQMRKEVAKVGKEMSDSIRYLADKLSTAASGSTSESGTEKRIEKLEHQFHEQRKDIQAILGILQSNFSPSSKSDNTTATHSNLES